MDYKVINKNTIELEARVKPYQPPKELDTKSAFRSGIEFTLTVTVEDLKDCDLQQLPKVVLDNMVSSIVISYQSVVRTAYVKSSTPEQYIKDYKALKAEMTTKPQTYVVKETVERTAGGGSAAVKMLREKDTMIAILSEKYPKEFQANIMGILQSFGSAENAEQVHERGLGFAKQWEKGKIAK